MSNLPVYQKEIIGQLPEVAKKYVGAKFLEPKASELPIQQMEVGVATIITNLLADAGYNDAKDKTVIIHLTTRLSEDMKTRFKHLTLSEIKIALNEGVRGNYGQFMGINITTLNNWVKSFEACEIRKMALIDFNTRLSIPTYKSEPTPEEIENIMQRGCNEAYEVFLKDGSIPYAARSIYDYLKKANGIKWTEPERLQIEHEAKVANDHKTRELKSVTVAQLAERLLGEKKRVALTKYFNKCKAGGINQILLTK